MALSTVLSAMRTLILDGWEIPLEMEARRTLYREKFSPLSEAELEDLVILPPEKIQVYTNTIYSGARSTLEMHFPLVFALLKSRFGERFDGFSMVQQLHKFRPWHGNTTLALAESFVAFLGAPEWPSGKNWIRDAAPEAPDLARMECSDLEISRGINPLDTQTAVFGPDEIAALHVGALLETELLIPANIRMFPCDYDVLAFRDSFSVRDGTIPLVTARRRMFLAGGRNREHYVRWVEISEAVFKLLDRPPESLNTEYTLPLGELVEATLVDVEAEDEEALFRIFMQTFSALETAGIIFVKK